MGELGILAHTKLSVCIRDMWKLRWLSCVWWNLERVRGGRFGAFGGGFMSFGGLWWSSSFPLFGELGGFCGVIGTSVLRFVYIFRSVGRVLSVWQHRAVGGSSDGGVKGIPLNNPLFG